MRALGKVALTDGAGHRQQLLPRLKQSRPQPDNGKDQQQRHKNRHHPVHHHHAFDAHFGGVVKRGDEPIKASDKLVDVGRDGVSATGLPQAGGEFAMPVILEGAQLFLLTVAFCCAGQFRAERGLLHLIKQFLVVTAQWYRGEQSIALHPQRSGFINGVRATLDALNQPARDSHTRHADRG